MKGKRCRDREVAVVRVPQVRHHGVCLRWLLVLDWLYSTCPVVRFIGLTRHPELLPGGSLEVPQLTAAVAEAPILAPHRRRWSGGPTRGGLIKTVSQVR